MLQSYRLRKDSFVFLDHGFPYHGERKLLENGPAAFFDAKPGEIDARGVDWENFRRTVWVFDVSQNYDYEELRMSIKAFYQTLAWVKQKDIIVLTAPPKTSQASPNAMQVDDANEPALDDEGWPLPCSVPLKCTTVHDDKNRVFQKDSPTCDGHIDIVHECVCCGECMFPFVSTRTKSVLPLSINTAIRRRITTEDDDRPFS